MRWIIGGALVALALSGCSSPDATDQGASLEDYTCAELAEEAAALGESSTGVTLIKVRNPEIVTDNRDDFELPAGDGETVLLKCRGTGVFDSGDQEKVEVRMVIDADEDMFVGWEAR